MIDIQRLKVNADYWDGCHDATELIIGIGGPTVQKVFRPDKSELGEWDGKGLPPVGHECELSLYKYWTRVVVLAYGKSRFLYEISPGQVDEEGDPIGGELEGSISCAKFRPILTQLEADKEELNQIIDAAMRSGDGDAAAAIMAAGWIKGGE